MGTLYIISTPIGNLDDITLRAIKMFQEVDIIVSEDVKKTKLLLSELQKRYPNLFIKDITNHFISCNEFEEQNIVPRIISLLHEGKNIAFVSEAGTPLISDPGYRLVYETIKQQIKVVPIPGVSAPIASLSFSGLPTDSFLFLGFLPKSKGKRAKKIQSLKEIIHIFNQKEATPTILFFESPHRLAETLSMMKEILGDITITLTREVTKKFEERSSQKLSQLLEEFETTPPKGEYTLLFSAKSI